MYYKYYRDVLHFVVALLAVSQRGPLVIAVLRPNIVAFVVVGCILSSSSSVRCLHFTALLRLLALFYENSSIASLRADLGDGCACSLQPLIIRRNQRTAHNNDSPNENLLLEKR